MVFSMRSSSDSSGEAPRQNARWVYPHLPSVVGRPPAGRAGNPAPKSASGGRLVRGRQLSGRVVGGEGLGRKLGYPTANLSPDLLARRRIRDGIYVALAQVGNRRYDGVAVIGVPESKPPHRRKAEVYLLEGRPRLYRKTLTLKLFQRLRPLRTFRTVSALKAQIRKDCRQARALLGR